MYLKNLLNSLLVALSVVMLTGCYILIEKPDNRGSVVSSSGAYDCPVSKNCSIGVYDIYFDEEFSAVPEEGFVFIGWKKRGRGLCGGDNKPCYLPTANFGDNPALTALLESEEIFYLTPVFKPVEGVKTVSLPGTWNYVETMSYQGSSGQTCRASGEIEHTVVFGEGHYNLYLSGSKRIIDASTCRLSFDVENPSKGLLTRESFYETVTEDEITSWQPAVYEANIISADKYLIKFQYNDGNGLVQAEVTYTRKI
jgi:hypothetical protein